MCLIFIEDRFLMFFFIYCFSVMKVLNNTRAETYIYLHNYTLTTVCA